MRGDRLSAYEQFDLSFGEAMANEFNHGLAALKEETSEGAKRFAGGAGRHGSFEESS
jgi:enoyl-CoA hydratase